MAIPRSPSPRGALTDPRTKVKVPTSVRTRGAATQRAVAATTGGPRLGTSLAQDLAAYRAGPPQEMLSQRQYAREQRQTAEEKYYGMERYRAGEFTEEAPKFDPMAVQRMMPSLMVVSLLGGSLSKLNALTQMKALNAAVEGYNQGNVDAHKRAMADWRQAYSEFQEREAARREQYQIDREARKDGLQMALNRQADADKAVNDYEQGTANNINMQLALNNERRAAERHAEDLLVKEATRNAKGKKSTLGQKQRDAVLESTVMIDLIDGTLNKMETNPEYYTTPFNIAYETAPRTTEIYAAKTGKTKQLAAQQQWRSIINYRIRAEAGLSQTKQEMDNQIKTAGTATLEGKRSGLLNAKLVMLTRLAEMAESDDDLKERLVNRLGMSPREAVQQVARQLGGEQKPTAPAGGARKTKSGVSYQVEGG